MSFALLYNDFANHIFLPIQSLIKPTQSTTSLCWTKYGRLYGLPVNEFKLVIVGSSESKKQHSFVAIRLDLYRDQSMSEGVHLQLRIIYGCLLNADLKYYLCLLYISSAPPPPPTPVYGPGSWNEPPIASLASLSSRPLHLQHKIFCAGTFNWYFHISKKSPPKRAQISHVLEVFFNHW